MLKYKLLKFYFSKKLIIVWLIYIDRLWKLKLLFFDLEIQRGKIILLFSTKLCFIIFWFSKFLIYVIVRYLIFFKNAY